MNGFALCAGYGGLDLSMAQVFGDSYRTVGYVEREIYSAEVLAKNMEEGSLHDAPIWNDICTFSGRGYAGMVDVLHAGLPCQPYSYAGKQKGDKDERALWPEFIRICGEVQPGCVFIENTPGFLKHFEPVYDGLCSMGFKFAPPAIWSASEVGAPHLRRRFFALAAHPDRINLRDKLWGSSGEGKGEGTSITGHNGEDGADSNSTGSQGRELRGERCTNKLPSGKICNKTPDPNCKRCERERGGREGRVAERGNVSADNNGRGREGNGGGWLFHKERQTLRHNADGCRDGCRTCGTHWETESPILRVDDGAGTGLARDPYRTDKLRAAGNGVVPQQAAQAFKWMADQIDYN